MSKFFTINFQKLPNLVTLLSCDWVSQSVKCVNWDRVKYFFFFFILLATLKRAKTKKRFAKFDSHVSILLRRFPFRETAPLTQLLTIEVQSFVVDVVVVVVVGDADTSPMTNDDCFCLKRGETFSPAGKLSSFPRVNEQRWTFFPSLDKTGSWRVD